MHQITHRTAHVDSAQEALLTLGRLVDQALERIRIQRARVELAEALGLGSSVMTRDQAIDVARFSLGPTCKVFTEDHREVHPGSGEAGQTMATQSILAILDGKVPDTVVNPDAIALWKQRFWS